MTNKNISQDYRRWIIQHSDPDSSAEAVALREDLWPKAIERAIEHGVLLIIHDKLEKADVAIPPGALPVVRDYLLSQILRIHTHQYFLVHLGRQIGNLPDFVVLKGVALATRLYSNPFQRPVRDMDILIRRKNYSFWLSFLKEMGFVLKPSEKGAFTLGTKGEMTLVNTGDGIVKHPIAVELHCELMDYRKRHIWTTALDRVWENREFVIIDGETIPVIGLSDLLPYLCVHQLLLHRHNRLIWAVDILLLIRKYGHDVFDREALAVIAANPAVRACVYYALYYAQTLFELPEVAEVMRELRPPRTSLYHYAPLLGAEEFLDDKAPWPSSKIAIFREIIKRGGDLWTRPSVLIQAGPAR